jgi:hypothetical protein
MRRRIRWNSGIEQFEDQLPSGAPDRFPLLQHRGNIAIRAVSFLLPFALP